MADGSIRGWVRLEGQAPRLCDAIGEGRRLVARCGCGAASEIDPSPWMAEKLGEARLSTLEGRLRCRCGARGAALDIDAGVQEAGAIFIWR